MFKARIIIADSQTVHRKRLKDLLTKAGYVVMNESSDGLKALKAIQQLSPDLAILDAQLGTYTGFQVARTLSETVQIPVITTSSHLDHDTFREAAEALSFAHLVKPVDEANLYASIEITLSNFRRIVDLQKEIKNLQQEIRSRKLVERAKGLLMKHQGLSESEAYNKLRTESMNRHTSMGRIADSIIAYYEIMQEK